MESLDAVVIGAGVVGLAIARALALAGREVVVLEAEERFGTQTSARNSEVIHAGIYYPAGSLKARLCVEGSARLYRYCAERAVAHRRLGKLLVATEEAERPLLDGYARKAAANGVTLAPLDADEVRHLEPGVRAVAGLWSERTGIVDAHGLMRALLSDAEQAGATLVTRTPVLGGRVHVDGLELRCGGPTPVDLRCRLLVNSAGLGAHRVAASLEGLPPRHPSVYPVPDQAGLGIHVTLDLAGQCKFGPDVTRWLATPDFSFEDGLEVKFARAIRRYWPALPDGALQPGFTGIRPKVSGPDQPAGDFVVQGPQVHGVPGLVNLFGIESPGLTASLALAAHVLELLGLSAPAS